MVQKPRQIINYPEKFNYFLRQIAAAFGECIMLKDMVGLVFPGGWTGPESIKSNARLYHGMARMAPGLPRGAIHISSALSRHNPHGHFACKTTSPNDLDEVTFRVNLDKR